jgi:CheY-like chemotaxis protein
MSDRIADQWGENGVTAKGTILAVDDTADALMFLSELLEAEGYDVRATINGDLAVRSAIGNPPDLILLDIHMPGMDGFEVCRRLRAHAGTRDVPVIFVSAHAETDKLLEGFALGAVDFVTKPYRREELLVRVRTHLEIHRLRHHLEDLVAERQQRFQDFAEVAADWFWESDADDVLRWVSRRIGGDVGCEFSEAIGMRRMDVIDAARDPENAALHNETLARHQPFRDFVYASSVWPGRFIRTSGKPLFSRTGEFLGYRGVACDVTEQVAGEQVAARALSSFWTLLDSLPFGVTLSDGDDYLLAANDRVWSLMGCVDGTFTTGTPFDQILRAAAEGGVFPAAAGRIEAWVAGWDRCPETCPRRLEPLNDGTTLCVVQVRSVDGGIFRQFGGWGDDVVTSA